MRAGSDRFVRNRLFLSSVRDTPRIAREKGLYKRKAITYNNPRVQTGLSSKRGFSEVGYRATLAV